MLVHNDLCYNITINYKGGDIVIKSRLKVLLAEHELTQKELAEKIDARLPTINDLCNNKSKQIPVKLLNDICNLFNCDIGDILRHENDLKSNKNSVDK